MTPKLFTDALFNGPRITFTCIQFAANREAEARYAAVRRITGSQVIVMIYPGDPIVVDAEACLRGPCWAGVSHVCSALFDGALPCAVVSRRDRRCQSKGAGP